MTYQCYCGGGYNDPLDWYDDEPTSVARREYWAQKWRDDHPECGRYFWWHRGPRMSKRWEEMTSEERNKILPRCVIF